ncbi:MAG: MarR family winged helix-turn-helix transcriptional regulator [Acidimicrobiales bacterium]
MSRRATGPDTGDEIIDALLMAGHRVRTATDARLREEGLSLSRLKVLRLLAEGPRSMGHVSAALEVVPRSTTDLVDGLVAAGLVERCPHPTDRRVVLLDLTAEGRSRLASSRLRATEVANRATGCIPADRRAALVDLLGRIGVPDDPGPESTGSTGAVDPADDARTR